MKVALVALALAGAAGCAHRARADAGDLQPEGAGSTTLQVINQYNLPLDVWTESAGVNTRLGAVGAGATSTFTLDLAMYRSLFVDIQAQVFGGSTVASSGSIDLRPGRVIEFTIDAHPNFSRTSIR